MLQSSIAFVDELQKDFYTIEDEAKMLSISVIKNGLMVEKNEYNII